ncbi:MAG TPA: MAPEG family protein, partial [Pseudolabrys sp.]|nr:MAPEG family protein [Pseudolabrys sp.]
VASTLRAHGWTPAGLMTLFSNRESMPPETALAKRADRATTNMLEGMVMFVAVLAAAHFAGKANSAQVQDGAALFFWARLAYWPCYLAGIIYLRTAIWLASVVGLAMIALAVL